MIRHLLSSLINSLVFPFKIFFRRRNPRMIIVDETWHLLQNEETRRAFIQELRVARKNGFMTIAVTQQPTDYHQEDGANP